MREQLSVTRLIRDAVMRMLTLDNSRWETMNSFREGYLEARASGDEESMDEIVLYAVEVLQRASGVADPPTVDFASIQRDPRVIKGIERGRDTVA